MLGREKNWTDLILTNLNLNQRYLRKMNLFFLTHTKQVSVGDEKVHREKKSRLLCTVRRQSLKQFKKVLFKNLTSNATHSIPQLDGVVLQM